MHLKNGCPKSSKVGDFDWENRCFGDVWCIPIFGKNPYDLSNGRTMVPRPDQAKPVDPKQARPWDLLIQWIQCDFNGILG
jgi:hypothetical protein